MPHRDRFAANKFYHLYNRGNNRQAIFFERENFVFLLRLFNECCPIADVEIVAYCLMPNHFHLLVRVLKEQALSGHMQSLALRYTKSVNASRNRTGSLLEGRFQSSYVDSDEYLIHLSRYIHLNPVEAGLVSKAEMWEFSSYRDYLGLRQGKLPKPDVVLAQFATLQAYKEFVESYQKSDKERIAKYALD